MTNTCTEYSNIQFAIDGEKQDEDSVKRRSGQTLRVVQVKLNEVLMTVEDAVEKVNGITRDYKCHCLVKEQ